MKAIIDIRFRLLYPRPSDILRSSTIRPDENLGRHGVRSRARFRGNLAPESPGDPIAPGFARSVIQLDLHNPILEGLDVL
jgi:hypothetical protein